MKYPKIPAKRGQLFYFLTKGAFVSTGSTSQQEQEVWTYWDHSFLFFLLFSTFFYSVFLLAVTAGKCGLQLRWCWNLCFPINFVWGGAVNKWSLQVMKVWLLTGWGFIICPLHILHLPRLQWFTHSLHWFLCLCLHQTPASNIYRTAQILTKYVVHSLDQ